MAQFYPHESGESDQLMVDIPSFDGIDFEPIVADNNNDNLTPFHANVLFMNLEEGQVFDKVQCRKGGKARQVLENAVINMKAIYNYGQLTGIQGWVRRTGDGNVDVPLMKSSTEVMNLAENFTDPEHGAIPVPEVINGEECQTLSFFVDLGNIFDDPSQPAFKLAKNETATKNRFQLIIQLNFIDRAVACESKIFRCKTKKRAVDQQEPSPTSSKQAKQSKINDNVPSSPRTPPILSPPSVTQSLITDTLTARTAEIDDLVVGQINTRQADIAYHLRIRDQEVSASLEEGDVVGFFSNENDGGAYVKLLQSDDIGDAVHAGVVSKSYYLAANKMPDHETETVCVIGMVNVKVIGSVENGERIYASIDRPGKAIPQSHLPVGSYLRKQHVLLGMSLEQKIPKALDKVHLVKCFVCIVLDVGRQEVLDEVERVYELTEECTEQQIKFASKKAWRKLRICIVVSLIIFVLMVCVLYQVFVPGSWFRYWLCRRGSVVGELRVSVIPYSSITTRINVHGIRFTFEGLKKKVPDGFTRNKVPPESYYFLNLDRCAYFGDKGPVRNWISGTYKDIGGGKILSINYNCSIVYWYGLHNGTNKVAWWPYRSRQHLRCTPNPPYE